MHITYTYVRPDRICFVSTHRHATSTYHRDVLFVDMFTTAKRISIPIYEHVYRRGKNVLTVHWINILSTVFTPSNVDVNKILKFTVRNSDYFVEGFVPSTPMYTYRACLFFLFTRNTNLTCLCYRFRLAFSFFFWLLPPFISTVCRTQCKQS